MNESLCCIKRNAKMEKYPDSKKCVFRNEETDLVNIYECGIRSIQFMDVETRFYIDWHEGYGSFVIKCIYPENVEFHISSTDERMSGYPYDHILIKHLEITGFSYLKEKNGYTIQFDFDNYPIGYIRLHCSEFVFEAPGSPLSSGGNDHRIPWDPMFRPDSDD